MTLNPSKTLKTQLWALCVPPPPWVFELWKRDGSGGVKGEQIFFTIYSNIYLGKIEKVLIEFLQTESFLSSWLACSSTWSRISVIIGRSWAEKVSELYLLMDIVDIKCQLCSAAQILPLTLRYSKTLMKLKIVRDLCHLFFTLCARFRICLPPAEGVEHVDEGDGHVNEDDQREQGVCKKETSITVQEVLTSNVQGPSFRLSRLSFNFLWWCW